MYDSGRPEGEWSHEATSPPGTEEMSPGCQVNILKSPVTLRETRQLDKDLALPVPIHNTDGKGGRSLKLLTVFPLMPRSRMCGTSSYHDLSFSVKLMLQLRLVLSNYLPQVPFSSHDNKTF
jgi:hypothetical protein